MMATILAMLVSLSAVVGAAQGRAPAARPREGKVLDQRLVACVKGGDAECVAQALAAGADAGAADESGVAALILASEGRSVRVVRLLLDAGADVNRARPGEGTPLCRAALFGRRENVETLLEKGAKVNVVCDPDHGDTALMDALRGAMLGGLPGEVREGLAGGGDIEADGAGDGDAKLREVLKAPRDEFLAIARLLLASGADVNVVAKCDAGETALMYAAGGASVELVRELLARGADVKQAASTLGLVRSFNHDEGKLRRLALPALSKGQAAMLAWGEETAAARAEIVRLLKAAGAREDEGEPEAEATDEQAARDAAKEAFNEAIERDDAEDFKRLVEAYAAHPLGAAALPEALRVAVIFKRTAMIRILLEREVSPDPNGLTARGQTPLMQAAYDGNVEYVRMLLDAGADVNVKDEDGKTALDLAEGWAETSEEHRAVVKLLRARGGHSKSREP